MKNLFYLSLLLLFFVSCSNNPEPIEYGKDACHFCSMPIVDKTHAAQAVSSKGKQFKYDAIECMVNDIHMNENTDMATKLVANYNNPGEMISAETAHYIISPNIPSPMGGNLSATANRADAETLQAEHAGEVLDWEELNTRNHTPRQDSGGHGYH